MSTCRWISSAALAASIACLAGCNKGASKKPAEGDKPAAEGTAAAATTEGADPCTDYATKLCEAAGDQSPSCAAAKQTTKIMGPAACKAGIADMAATKAKLADLGKSCTELSTRLCKDLGEETQSCAMVKSQTPNFPPERCDGMLSQYDKVLADLQKREEANKPLTEDKLKAITENAVATFGPDTAKVTIVEFSDFQCPYCSRAATAVHEIKKKYEGKDVRFVFRQFPLSFHQDAHLAAQAALAAANQGKFWEFHDALFANQAAIKRDDLEKHAKEIGLDVAAFKKALDSESNKAAVDADLKLGELVAVTGTPTMFVNGTRVANPSDTAMVSGMIDAELAK